MKKMKKVGFLMVFIFAISLQNLNSTNNLNNHKNTETNSEHPGCQSYDIVFWGYDADFDDSTGYTYGIYEVYEMYCDGNSMGYYADYYPCPGHHQCYNPN